MRETESPKILYVFCSDAVGGAEIVMRRLVTHSGFPPLRAVVLCSPGSFAESLRAEGVETRTSRGLSSLQRGSQRRLLGYLPKVFRNFLLANLQIIRLVYREKITHVHANNLNAAVYALPSMLCLRWLKGKSLQWLWSNHDMGYPQWKLGEKLASLCHRLFDRSLAVSEAVKSRYPEFSDKIEVLYNGLDMEVFRFSESKRRRFREEQAIPQDAWVIGIVGAVCPAKGQRLLADVFPSLLERHPRSFLLIVGLAPARAQGYLERLLRSLDALPKDRYRYTGPLRDMPSVYSGLDVLVNATDFETGESLGTTLYEAMSCERLVVASKVGGNPEIVDDGRDGFLFEASNPDSLLLRLEAASDSSDRLRAMREAARRKVREKFAIEAMASSYRGILAGSRNREDGT